MESVQCQGKTYSGAQCPYRATCMEHNLCGVHKFIGKDDDCLKKVLPFMFNGNANRLKKY
jgi:hypothetical protein